MRPAKDLKVGSIVLVITLNYVEQCVVMNIQPSKLSSKYIEITIGGWKTYKVHKEHIYYERPGLDRFVIVF